MSHRVIQLDSKVSSSSESDRLKTKIQGYINDSGYSLHTFEVNDGIDLEDNPTLGVNADLNDATEANEFYDWLWSLAQDNKASYKSDGSVEIHGFGRVRLQVHDCKHLAGLQEPCEIGNSNKYDATP